MSDHDPIPSLAEALTEIRRLRAHIAEYEARHASDIEYLSGLQDRIKAREDEFVELPSLRARIAELEAINAMVVGTVRSAVVGEMSEPATYTHNVPPSAPPHDE